MSVLAAENIESTELSRCAWSSVDEVCSGTRLVVTRWGAEFASLILLRDFHALRSLVRLQHRIASLDCVLGEEFADLALVAQWLSEVEEVSASQHVTIRDFCRAPRAFYARISSVGARFFLLRGQTPKAVLGPSDDLIVLEALERLGQDLIADISVEGPEEERARAILVGWYNRLPDRVR